MEIVTKKPARSSAVTTVYASEAQRIADGIKDLIETGQLRPGARTPSLDAIMQSEGVSRVTASSVIKRLKTEGYAKAVRGGTEVIDRSDWLIERICDYLNQLEAADQAPRIIDNAIRTNGPSVTWNSTKERWEVTV